MKRLIVPLLGLALLAAACTPATVVPPTSVPPTVAPPTAAAATNTAAPAPATATAAAPATNTAAPATNTAAPTDTTAAPATAPTAAPTAAPQDQPLRVVVRSSDDSVHIVGTGLSAAGVNFNQGLLPMGGSANGIAYVLDFKDQPKAQMVDGTSNVTDLTFIDKPNYGLAVWPGDGAAGAQPRLAWATSPTSPDSPTQLFIANADGSELRAVITETIAAGAAPYQLVAQRWSADGQSLYFSREPYGIGGYIPYAGASSLYRYSLADGSVTELIPFSQGHGMICLDDLSADAKMTVGNCVLPNQINVHYLSGGKDGLIAAPSAVTDYRLAGGARFSPDDKQVAYGLAQGDPTAEQGWLALSAGLADQSNLLHTSDPGQYYTVVAWLNNDTLLIQLNSLACNPTCANSLWTINKDGSGLTQLADGTFLTLF
jgi:hypothetical protein